MVVFHYRQKLYFVLFLVIFCEKAVVFKPIYAGDSMLFAVGALAPTTIRITSRW